MMRNKLIAVSAALVLPMQVAHAAAGEFSAQLALSDSSLLGASGGSALVLGYELDIRSLPKNLSLEGEFTTSLSDIDLGVGTEMSYYTLGGYMKYTLPVNQKFSVYGRAGLLYEDVEIRSTQLQWWHVAASGTDIGLSLGAGADLKVSQRMSLTAGLTIIESDINHLSAGLRYKF